MRYGGSSIDESLLVELKAALPGVDFMQAYGQTEGFPVSLLHDCDHTEQGVESGRTRSAGTICYGMAIEIRDSDGNPLPRGEIGEICLSGPSLMLGYLNMPEKTAETLVDGWLITGDAGYLTEDDYLHVVDRIKDMIVTGVKTFIRRRWRRLSTNAPVLNKVLWSEFPMTSGGERVHAEIILKPGAEGERRGGHRSLQKLSGRLQNSEISRHGRTPFP